MPPKCSCFLRVLCVLCASEVKDDHVGAVAVVTLLAVRTVAAVRRVT